MKRVSPQESAVFNNPKLDRAFLHDLARAFGYRLESGETDGIAWIRLYRPSGELAMEAAHEADPEKEVPHAPVRRPVRKRTSG